MRRVYLVIFTFELLTKIVAYGFVFTEHAYLKDAWCQLDFVVVTLAWLPILFPQMGNYSVIRSVRALRPLRALKRMPGMPVMINSLLAALPKLGDVMAMCFLIVVVLGVAGTTEFKGTLHYRCAYEGFTESPNHPSLFDELHPTIPWAIPLGIGDGQGRRLESIGEHSSLAARPRRALRARRRGRYLKGGDGGGGGGGGGGGNQSEYDSQEFCDPLADVQRSVETRRRGRQLKGGGGGGDSSGGGGDSSSGGDATCPEVCAV